MATTTQPADHRRGLLRFRPRINRDKLLLKQYGLTKFERFQMYLWGTGLSQIAIPIGSAIYFLTTQVAYQTRYGNTVVTYLYWKDAWDRLPIHVANLFHKAWFHGSQVAPTWWVTARHDARHVMIGTIAILLIGAVMVGLKPNKEPKSVSGKRMILSVFEAIIGVTVTATLLILFFTKVTRVLDNVGLTTGNSYLSDLLGKGTIQLTLIGVVCGFVAKRILRRTFATIQMMSIERNIAQGATPRKWWVFVYPPNYRKRFKYVAAQVENGREVQMHSRWLGLVLTFGTPILLFWLAFGIYLNYFGPASGAH